MYVAFWLDPNTKDPNKRVVVCQPFTKKPTTAWAVLRAAIRENRTGGILAGAEEDLQGLIEKIDQADQNWPDQSDRIVAQITKLAQQCQCTVVFRQNMEPSGVSEHTAALFEGLHVGQPQVTRETESATVVRFPLSGQQEAIKATLERAARHGWVDENPLYRKRIGDADLTLQYFSSIQTRAALEIKFPVQAKSMTKRNSAGYSEEFHSRFSVTNELLDTILGPTAKRFKFVLLIREDQQNCIVFCGTKNAQTVRQAVEQYVAHLQDEESSSEPLSSQEDSDEKSSDLMDKIAAPAIQNCRFWKL